jgi:hypothetical protein
MADIDRCERTATSITDGQIRRLMGELSARLQSVRSARTVRVMNAKPSTTDGTGGIAVPVVRD